MDQLAIPLTWLWYVPLWLIIGAIAGVMSERRGIVVAAAAGAIVTAFSANHVLQVTSGGPTQPLFVWFPFGSSDIVLVFFYAVVAALGAYLGDLIAERRRVI